MDTEPPTKECPVCDGSGQMPGAMRAVIYRPEVGGDVLCWVCHGEGSIGKDTEISPVWLAYGKSRKALS